MNASPVISFEFFPPKTAEGVAKLREARTQLAQLQPKFFSVTFGAGGSTRDRTMETVFEIQSEGFDAAPHISCVSSSRGDIGTLLDEYRARGIRRLVALRGDLPSGFNFMDQCGAMGIDIPVVPGVMPIYNYTQLARFSGVCGAEIPRWLRLRLQDYSDDLPSLRALGTDVVTDLCEQLLAGGAPGLHFYTLNQAGIISTIAQRLGL